MSRGETKARTEEIIGELIHESDRGLALISAELLNEELEGLLRSKLRIKKPAIRKRVADPMFNSSTGPLHSFSSRIKFAYAFGWITEDLFEDLERIRSIRNEFAHSSGALRFTSQSIAARAKLLRIGYEFETLFMFLQTPHSKILRMAPGTISSPRAAFLGCTIFARGELMGLAGKFGKNFKPLPRREIMLRWDKVKALMDAGKLK